MASYDKSKDSDYTRRVQQVLAGLGADLGAGGVDGKWGAYTQAAYEANRSAVDAALGGGSGGFNFQSLWDSLPQLNYSYVSTPSYSYEYYYSIGDALEEASYTKQKAQAEQDLAGAQEALKQSVKQTKANIEKSTNARGFARSSYTTDALQNTDLTAMRQEQSLLASFDQTLLELDAQRHSNASAYAANAFQAQEDRRLQADMFNARMANELALNQWQAQLDMINWQMQQWGSGTSSASRSSGSSRSSSGSTAPKSSASGSGKVRVSAQRMRTR